MQLSSVDRHAPDAGPTGPPPASSGERVQLLEELGRGARSVVFRAERDGRSYAVKVLTGAAEREPVAAFAREAALLTSLRHPGLVTIHEVGRTTDGSPYMIMDLVQGQPLSRMLSAERLDDIPAAAAGAQVAEVLAVAHGAALVHRDVKPANILIEPDGRARLIDFGLAARTGGSVGDGAVGTFVYSAPEQTGMLRRPVDGRADLYSLGAVLFECVTGQPPFAADDAGELMRLHLSAAVPDPRDLRPDVAPALAAVIMRLLAKDPDDRYARAGDVHHDLARVAGGERDFALLDAAPGYGAGALSGGRSGSESPAPLVGRADELAQLRSRWHDAAGGRGGVVVVEGPAGVGKTRLGAELSAAAEAAGHPWLRGAAHAEEQAPLAPLRAALAGYVRTVSTLAEPQRGRAVAAIERATGTAMGLLAEFVPALGQLVDVPAQTTTALGGRSDPLAGTGVDEDRFAEVFSRFLIGLADTHGGAVLQLDDAQWWDAATRQVVRRLAGDLRTSRLLVLVTARDEATGALDAAIGAVDPALDARLRVAPLSWDDVAALVADQLGTASVPPPLIDLLASRSGGNPLAVREYVRAALDAGVLRPSWGSWVLDEAGLDELDLPADVIALMLRRVAELDPDAQELLVVAAAVGGQFTAELAGAVLARRTTASGPATAPERAAASEWATGSVDVPAALAAAVAHRVIEPAGGRYAFTHERIRHELLARLDEADRRDLRQHIAEQMEAAEGLDTAAVYAIADHYLHGAPDSAPERLFRAAAAAGTRALGEYASAQAYTYFARASAAADAAGVDPGVDVHAGFALAANRVGEHETAQDQVRRALAGERNPNRRARLYGRLAESLHVQWKGRQAMEMAHLGLAQIGRAVPTNPLAAVLTTLWSVVASWLLRLLPSRLSRAEGELRERYQIEVQLSGLIAQSAAYAMRPQLAGLMMLRSTSAFVRLGSGPDSVLRTAGRGVAAEVFGRPARAERFYGMALAQARALGDPEVTARVHLVAALGRDAQRPPHAGTGDAFKATLNQHGQWLLASDYLLVAAQLGLFALVRGHVAEAATWYERAARRVGADGAYGNPAAALGAGVAALSGQAAEAARRLAEVQAYADSNPDNIAARLNTAIHAVHTAVEQGELGAPFDEAVAAFRAVTTNPRQVFLIQRTFWIFQALGRLAQAGAAEPADRQARLAAAAVAVRELRRAAKGPLYRAYATVTQAWLDQLSDRPRQALRRLAALNPAADGYNCALADYEAARVRARALIALGRRPEAARQAHAAALLATEHGWQTRSRWVRVEFDLAGTVGTTGHAAPRTFGANAQASPLTSPPSLATGTGTVSRAVGLHGRRLQAVHQVGLAAAEILDPRQLSRVALDETVRIFAAERAFLFVVDHDDAERLMPFLGRDNAGADLETLAGYGASLVERVRDTGEPLVVTGSEQGAALGSQSTLVHGLRSIMVAPVRFKGRLLGVVYLDSRAARGIFTLDDVEILSAITNQIAVTFETARAAQLELDVRTARTERDLAEMLRIAMIEISGTLDPDEVTRRTVDLIARAVPFDTWSVLFRTDDGTVAAFDDAQNWSLVDSADQTVRQLIDRDDPWRPDGLVPLGSAAGFLGGQVRTAMVLPLVMRGEKRGALLLGTASARAYTDGEARIAATLAGQGMAAYDNALLFRQVRELATRDGLTGLFNRRHYFELVGPHMTAQQRHPRPVAAVMVDIDRFKKINDTYGHAVGDEVIRAVAGRLAGCLRSSDIICRYGGEEFAVLLTEASAEQAETVARRLHAAVGDTPVDTDSGPLGVTVSVGVTVPAVGLDDVHALLNTADQALYAAKRSGRNQVVSQPVTG